NRFYAEVVSGVLDGCNRSQKELLIYGDLRAQSVEDVYARLTDRRIDGLVIWSSPEDPLAARLLSPPIPMVAIVDALSFLPSVVGDDADGMRQMLSYLRARGHSRLLLLCDRPDANYRQASSILRRRQAAVAYARETGCDFHVWSADIGARKVDELLTA